MASCGAQGPGRGGVRCWIRAESARGPVRVLPKTRSNAAMNDASGTVSYFYKCSIHGYQGCQGKREVRAPECQGAGRDLKRGARRSATPSRSWTPAITLFVCKILCQRNLCAKHMFISSLFSSSPLSPSLHFANFSSCLCDNNIN